MNKVSGDSTKITHAYALQLKENIGKLIENVHITGLKVNPKMAYPLTQL